MKARDQIGRSMPRKSKHGHKVSRWTTHRAIKAFIKNRGNKP